MIVAHPGPTIVTDPTCTPQCTVTRTVTGPHGDTPHSPGAFTHTSISIPPGHRNVDELLLSEESEESLSNDTSLTEESEE